MRSTNLSVWIVRRLETEILNAHLFEEYTHETCARYSEHLRRVQAGVRTNQISQCQSPVGNDALHLVKFR